VNLAIKAAIDSGFKHFFLLNNDAVLLHGSGPYIEHALRQHPATIIAPTIRWGDHTVCGSSYHKYFSLVHSAGWKSGFGWFNYISGCAFIFDITCTKKVGLFDESFFMYGEDAEYCYRAADKQISLLPLKHQLIRHYGSRSSKKALFFYEYHVNRAHFLLTLKMLKQPTKRILAFSAKTLILSARALWRSLKYRTIDPLLAFILAPFELTIRPK